MKRWRGGRHAQDRFDFTPHHVRGGRTPPAKPPPSSYRRFGWRPDFLLLSRDAPQQDIRLRKRNAGLGDGHAPTQVIRE